VPDAIKILAVDDSMVVLHMYRLLLSPTYQVVTASNGIDALHMLQDDPEIKLVLLDINMPRMNGFEFLQAVRKTPLYYSTHIIVVTTQGSEEDAGIALSLGARGYITKPYEPQGLLRLIAASLPGVQERRATQRQWWFQQPASGERRVECNQVCEVSLGPQRSHGVVCNMSSRGLYVALASLPMPREGDTVCLTFSLADDAGPIQCEARVAWANPSACLTESGAVAPGLPAGCGVRFTRIDPADQARIDARVQAALPAKKP
jgi:CheY-like chemotaxis protein/Tfp pilus assembly protein PilZ